MNIQLTPEQEATILQIAQHEGKTPSQLIFDATIHFYQGDAYLDKILEERIRKADEGGFIEEDEMDARFRKMLHS